MTARVEHPVRYVAKVALVTAVVAYGGAMGYLKLTESSHVYQPNDAGEEAGRINAPADSLHVERVAFTSHDGARLAAWVVPAAGTGTTGMWVLICHGNAGNITLTKRQDFYARLRNLGLAVLAYDYRGFGESEKRAISEAGLYADAQAAYDFLRHVRGVPPERIVIFGHSLGSGVAVELATHAEAAGLVLEGAFTGVDLVAQQRYPWFPVRAVMSNHFDSIDRIDRVSMPKLFLHAGDDAVIPIALGRELLRKAREPKRLVEVTGGHEDAFRLDPLYMQAFAGFVRRVVPESGPAAESRSPAVAR